MEDPQCKRRSKRERTSTALTIMGYTVLTKNNYTVSGVTYKHGAHEPDDGIQNRKNKAKVPPTTKPAAPKKPRKMTLSETERSQHNARIVANVEAKRTLQTSFFVRNEPILRPCIHPTVAKKLASLSLDASQNYNTPFDQNSCKAKTQPAAILATLRDYQMEGFNFLLKMHHQNVGMILGDEMGLGKTLQTIAFLTHLKETGQIKGPSLVVCPLTVLTSWCSEFERWNPSLKYFRLHSSGLQDQVNQKEHLLAKATEYDIILTSYEMPKASLLKSIFQRIHFNYLVLDEGHKIKGHDTLVAQVVRMIHCENRLILTGTPLQNNMVELWSLLNFLCPKIFTSSEPFERAFNLHQNIIDKKFLLKAQKVLELFMIRRLKVEVEKLMPKKIETKVYCPISKAQKFWYKALLMKDINVLARMDGEEHRLNFTVLKSLFMQLRKCCNHPFVFEGSEVNPDETSLEDLVAASGKLAVLDKLLISLFQKRHRCVLFSQFTRQLDILEDYCNLRGWNYCRFDGSTKRALRNHIIRQFNAKDSPIFLFLMTTKSGGMGLNLQSADTCIIYDSDWNPQADIQAMARVHRIGQTKTVHVYRLITSGTVEERMLERAEKKLLLEVVNRESKKSDDKMDQKESGLTAKELLSAIKFGSQAVFGDSRNSTLPTDSDIEQITDRNRLESHSVGMLKGGVTKSADSFDETKDFSETQTFEGVNFRDIRSKHEKAELEKIPSNLRGIGRLWEEISGLSKKRQVKNRILYVQGNGSGYGMKNVPVLSSNNYDLQEGESSVFDRELHGRKKQAFEIPKKGSKGSEFENQDFCQYCGDGGSLVCCNYCPVSVHLECCGVKSVKDFQKCPHHRCFKCQKHVTGAGGVLYPCHACTVSYCEDCLPEEYVTVLGTCDRFEEKGFDPNNSLIYINCSNECADFAAKYLDWNPSRQRHGTTLCPPPLDVSYGFGTEDERIPISNAQSSATKEGVSAVKLATAKLNAEKKESNESNLLCASGPLSAPSSMAADPSVASTSAIHGFSEGAGLKGSTLQASKVKAKYGSTAIDPIVLSDDEVEYVKSNSSSPSLVTDNDLVVVKAT